MGGFPSIILLSLGLLARESTHRRIPDFTIKSQRHQENLPSFSSYRVAIGGQGRFPFPPSSPSAAGVGGGRRGDSPPPFVVSWLQKGGTIFLSIVHRRKEGEKSTLMTIAGAEEEREEARELKPQPNRGLQRHRRTLKVDHGDLVDRSKKGLYSDRSIDRSKDLLIELRISLLCPSTSLSRTRIQ